MVIILNFLETLSTTKDIRRIKNITSILLHYGFDSFVSQLRIININPFIDAAQKPSSEKLKTLPAPQRAVAALEEMGPTFVKFGQLLATRVDLLPPEWIEAFESLHASVSPLPWSQIEPVLAEALNCEPSECFDHIDIQPLAAGSIAQVHRAKLNNEDVILKIQRPGIKPIIEADLRLMSVLAEWIGSEITVAKRFRPKQIIRQFATAMRRELDFTRECRTADRIRRNFENSETLVIPEVYWEFTSPTLNVQEFIQGITATDMAAIDSSGLDRKQLALNGVDMFLRMSLEHGFFHADPHPGNMFFLEGNRIALIDFGLVGTLTDYRRGQIALIMQGGVAHDSETIVDVLSEWAGDVEIDRDALVLDVEALMDEYLGVSLEYIQIDQVFLQLTSLSQTHSLTLPPDLTLLIKAISALQAIALRLNPEFDLIGEAEPFVRRAILQRYSPDSIFKRVSQSASHLSSSMVKLPRDLRRFREGIKRGSIPISVSVEDVTEIGDRIEKASNRATIGIIVAALIVGSSIVLTVDAGPKFLDLPFFGLTGFISASLGGTWVVISMWLGRR